MLATNRNLGYQTKHLSDNKRQQSSRYPQLDKISSSHNYSKNTMMEETYHKAIFEPKLNLQEI